jgi:predicted transcriptional regulator
LSDVIAGAKEGDLWITLQIHQNIIAVAFLNNLAGIVIVGGREPDAETLKKAEEQGVPVLVSPKPAYELAGRLYGMGIRRESEN